MSERRKNIPTGDLSDKFDIISWSVEGKGNGLRNVGIKP